MPDSDRSERLPGWVKAVGYGGLCLAAAALLSGLFYQVHYAQQAEYGAAEYARNAARESYQPCRISPVAKLNECLAQAEREYRQKRNDNRREYADLVAQQRSALWTAIMGMAALIGMALSAIGVWLVYTTFRETRRSAHIAQDNLAAFKKAERGHFEIHIQSGFMADAAFVYITARVGNHGTSRLKVLKIEYSVLALPTFPDALDQIKPFKRAFEAGETTYESSIFRIREDGPSYIGGRVVYECKFGEIHYTYFCSHLEAIPIGYRVAGGASHTARDCREGNGWPDNT